MSNMGVSTIGQNVARYRKLAKLSAADLADAVGLGLTRSVVANLENGRKDDVTVSQLIGLSKALGVPPVALAVDLTHPNGLSDFDMPPRTFDDFDFETQIKGTVETPFRNAEALRWFGGDLPPHPSEQTAAQKQAYGTISALGAYSLAFSRWQATAVQIALLRKYAIEKPDEFKESNSNEHLAYLENTIEDEAAAVVSWVAMLDQFGVVIETTPQRVESAMRRLGFAFMFPTERDRG